MFEQIVIGCDPAISKKGPAFSVWRGESCIHWTQIPCKHDKGIIDPITKLAIHDLLLDYYCPTALLVIESTYLHPNPKKRNPLTFKRLTQIISAITGIAQSIGYEIEEVTNQEWTVASLRCQTNTDSDTRKRLSLLFAVGITGDKTINDDKADAINIGGYRARRI